jgi:hypothetical protein
MLDALAPAAPAAPAATAVAPAAVPPRLPTTEAPPETNLVGKWQAKAGDTTIELTIGEDLQFTWKAAQSGKPALQLNGQLVATSETLVLESKEQGSMVGSVKSDGADKWQFALAGTGPNDPGLRFERMRG